MDSRKKILVVDDEEKILDIVKAYLEKENYGVYIAQTGQDAINLAKSIPFSLILLDLMLPDMSGEAVCQRIRQDSSVPIIMMTAKIDEESIINGLSIGADDYVTKPFSPRQLVARVAATLRRACPNEDVESILSYAALSVDLENRMVTKSDRRILLTPNEYKILVLLMSRPKKIFTRDEIILSIKNDEFDGFDRTIDSHIRNLRQKIEDNPRKPEYVITVYGVGYQFGGND